MTTHPSPERNGDAWMPVIIHRHDDPANTDLADLGERPDLVVVHPPSSQGGTGTFVRPPQQPIPLREATILADSVFAPTTPAEDRKVLDEAGVLGFIDEAIATTKKRAEGSSLAVFNEGEQHGYRMGLNRAVGILNRYRDTAEAKGDDDVVAAFDDLATALLGEADS